MLDQPLFGLPLDSWLLIAASVGIGAFLELLFLRNQRLRGGERTRPDGESRGEAS